jgi:hypothetical protein
MFMNYQCPVCGYDQMKYPAKDYNICPCCGTEFEADDFETTHAQLRQQWKATGMQWYSRRTPPPFGWNPSLQLLKFLNFKEVSKTESTIAVVNLNEKRFKIRKSDYGDVITVGNLFCIGNSGLGTGLTASNNL